MWKDFLYYTKTERQGIIVLVVLILGVYAAPKLFSFFTHAEDTDCRENEKFDKEYNDFISSLRETQPHQKSGHSFQSSPQREIKLAMFDPNTADSTTFLSLGLPSWMIKNILHYRYKQGKFRHPEDFRKIYGLTEEQYQTLRPYIQITEDFSSTNKDTVRLLTAPSIQRDTLVKYLPGTVISLNSADTTELKKIPGIGSSIARMIVNYRERLGGFFRIEQLQEIHLKAEKLRPWFSIDTHQTRRINVNKAGMEHLAGEMPTQDAAMLRLLLAVLFTVFSRVNVEGEPEPFEEEDDALARWGDLWQLEHFPEQPLRDYLEQWKDRFWLFHPTHPFWQVPGAEIGTACSAAMLNDKMIERKNKLRLFPLYAGQSKERLSYPQAARWLLSVNGFDDTSLKPKEKNLPSISVGWLGSLGYIQALGNNLYETLMLNLTLLKDGREYWSENRPCWELETPRSAERTKIPCPDDPAQLLTLQSRRLLLHRTEGMVDGYFALGGDFFSKENAFAEQMTVWRNAAKKNEPAVFVPCRHDPARQFWRE